MVSWRSARPSPLTATTVMTFPRRTERALVPRGGSARRRCEGRDDAATMTWDLYGHLYDDDLDNVAERLATAHTDYLRQSCVHTVSKTGNVVGRG